jgi:hypothetical protein
LLVSGGSIVTLDLWFPRQDLIPLTERPDFIPSSANIKICAYMRYSYQRFARLHVQRCQAPQRGYRVVAVKSS